MTPSRLDEATASALLLGMAMGTCAGSRLRLVAKAVADCWTPYVGRDRAAEAANNLLASVGMGTEEPVAVVALEIIEHRIAHFGWPRLDEAVRLAMARNATLIVLHAGLGR